MPPDISQDRSVVSASAKIRTFDGETPLQVMARQGHVAQTSMTSLERFPYYTAFPFAWYPIVVGESLAVLVPPRSRPVTVVGSTGIPRVSEG